MDYLLKSSLLVIILVGFYYFFLRNETFFKSIRTYFIVGLFIATLLPLIEIPVYIEAVAQKLEGYYFTEGSTDVVAAKSFDWIKLLVSVYLLGVVVLLLKLVLQFASLFLFLRKNDIQKNGSYRFVKTKQNIAPFSFFNTIVYNPDHFSQQELNLIVEHELAHARQLHSVDTILTQLLVILLWFNPFAWLLKKAVQQNLEFLADAEVPTNSRNEKLYKLTLLKTCTNNLCTDISNNFYNSIIKNRIIMLQKNPSRKSNQLKYALLIPVLAIFLFTFNTKTIAQEKEDKIHINVVKVELTVDKNTTDETLDSEVKTFNDEFGVKLSFKGVKRNSDGEITGIKITAKSKSGSTSYDTSGDEPIKPIQISYDSDNNNLNISSLSKVHKSHYSYKVKDKGENVIIIKEGGENMSWTSKKGEGKKVIIDGDEEHVWIEKDGEKKIVIQEVKKGDGEKHEIIVKEMGDHENNVVVEIKSDGGNDENVFIIKSDGDDVKHVKKKGNFVYFTDSNEKPLYIIDGKESNEKAMKDLNPNQIKSMNVLKGESAEKKYGDKGKNGVIEIKTKKE